MEEEVGIKVTRLRRRLSVEADDVKSPSTPTKKRGGRLAAKPQLELIDENAPEAVPKRMRKSTVKEAEPVEEKTVTPSRRSIRIRSNTSIVSETPDVAEDKGTPSRRSTRIKSNTSLIAEPVNVDSPRAKRAARRTSLVGSDTEAPITPARQTRRTRNNSTSSIDKPVETTSGKLSGEIKDVIVEETESVKETKNTEKSQNNSYTLRKSPRLVGKSGRTNSLDNDNKENEPCTDQEASQTTAATDKSMSQPQTEQSADLTDNKAHEQINLSMTSKNLIQELDEAPKKAKSIFNKSTTAVEEPQIKIKRNRTKSWTTISVESPQESSFCSDSEATKKRNKKKTDILNFSIISGSGDGIMNTSNKNNEIDMEQGNLSLNTSTLSKKKKRHEISMTVETEPSENKSVMKLSDAEEVAIEINEELDSTKKLNRSVTEKLFEQAPTGVVQSLVFIEDSDSNHENIGKENSFHSGDQCVPVVDHPVEDKTSKHPQSNLSYEPMDIDETMPENVSIPNFIDKNNSASEKTNSILNISQVKNDNINKSKKKSEISNMISEENIVEASAKSPRKSVSEIVINNVEDNNKSERQSSRNNGASVDTTDGIFNSSNLKSLVIDMNNQDESINKKANISKRKSSISNLVNEQNTDEDSNNSTRKSINRDKSNDESMNKEVNKSKRNSSLSNMMSDEITNDISNKSRKSSVTEAANDEIMDRSINKSKRKSLSVMAVEVSMDNIKTPILEDNDMVSKNSNKSKRKSSISNMPNDSMEKNTDKSKNKSDPYLDKTENNENKSTLVLSQLKDVSENEINVDSTVAKDNNDSNEQLSKSVNVTTEKDTDKKNLSLTYSTSTPLKQKSLKKLGLQINSSIIAPNSANKVDKKITPNKSKKESAVMIEEDGSDPSEDEEDDVEEESEESSEKGSKIIDDEAEEASDDYESGDSRDEEEREYEEQNKVIEKGETLDSDEEDFSDDSDYEKDSFIVTSDAEDQDLLSGSGDDLSMSANELTMSAKSKKKFNEREIKEQKNASRQMYEARHKLNKSNQSPKSKKNNRQRFDTSSSESEEEIVAQPKKNRRLRIDSTHEASTLQSDTDMSLSKKKKKNKARRLSESLCADDEINEKEITICDENQTDKDDPLTLLNVIKEEPKTPQKALNISTVAVTNMDEVEEVNVDENVSILKSNQTSDPLQATIAENDEDDNTDDGSITENEEITASYETVLNNLNKSGSKKIKASNISLDLNKKTKQKAKEPIVDQLNLTQIKKSKKQKGDSVENAKELKKQDKSLNKSVEKIAKHLVTLSEGSSDSIDMKLLFNEDSNDSEAVVVNKKEAVREADQNEDDESPGDFIPLKRSQGKTNMLENMDIADMSYNESILNVSGKKKNKCKSYQSQDTLEIGASEDDNLGFFIDTTGTLTDKIKSDANTSFKSSGKKNKQKNLSFTGKEVPVDEDSNDAPLEVSYRSEKNKSKQNLNTTQNNEVTHDDNDVDGTLNQSAKKKKNKKALNSSQNAAEISVTETTDEVPEKSINISLNKKRLSESQEIETATPAESIVSMGSTKKQKQKLNSEITATDTAVEPIMNVSLGSAKKKKQKTITENTTTTEAENVNKEHEDVISQELVTKKRKRKSSANQTIDEIIITDDIKHANEESIMTKNQKKKLKISNNTEEDESQVKNLIIEAQEENIPVVNKKKKTKLQQQKEDEIVDGATKKNKKRKERDEDDINKISKVLKQNSFDKVHVPRLPSNVLKQLDDKPKKDVVEAKKAKVVSTSQFVVEETKRRYTPSNYLEESVYCINDDMDEKRQKRSIRNPKVLPFIPTASTSDSGFTTKFRVNVISQETQFVAQSRDVPNYKNDYLHKKRIKKLGTFEMYKRQRNIKIAKF